MKHTVEFSYEGKNVQFDLYTNLVKIEGIQSDITALEAPRPLRLEIIKALRKREERLSILNLCR